MHKSLFLVIALLLIIGVGLVLFKNKNEHRGSTNNQQALDMMKNIPPTSAKLQEKNITITQQNNSFESGTATLRSSMGKTIVVITVAGAPTTSQPAHIHMGSCPNPGAVKYPLQPVKDGRSETTLDVSFDTLLKDLPLAINIHRSAQDIKVYVACGDIK